MKELQIITDLSHEFGTPDYVKGGGGNTSVKNEDTIWIKPSGTTLSELSPDRFVPVDRLKLGALYEADIPSDSTAREAVVKEIMSEAVVEGHDGRPSVETPLHDILDTVYVVHTHAVLVNGLTCAANGEEECRRLYPGALWVPYIDPGFTLSMDVRDRVGAYKKTHGRSPDLLLLENHGIFVTGNTADEIRIRYREVIDALKRVYGEQGIPLQLQEGEPADPELVAGQKELLKGLVDAETKEITYRPSFSVFEGPISPDHMVYAKAYPFKGAFTAEEVKDYRDEHGYSPRIFVGEEGVYAAGSSLSKAQLAMDMANDGGLLEQLSQAFGGIQYLSVEARNFIEHWEVEAYRQTVIT